MNLEPLLDAPLAIQIHVATVVPAALIGPWMFWARKGTSLHRLVGKVWMGLMLISAISSFFIHQINLIMGFSPIHLISVYVIIGIWRAYRSARTHQIARHKKEVLGLYLGGIVGAGAFTLLPGRIVHDVLFVKAQTMPDAGQLWPLLAVMAVATFAMFVLALLSNAKRPRAGTH